MLADVLVSETFGDDPLAERFLVSFKDAAARFLTPNASVVPCRLSVTAMLISSDHVRSTCCPPPGSALWTHLSMSRASVRLAEVPHVALSRAFRAVAMDWNTAAGGQLVVPELRGSADVEVAIVAGGEAHGFVFWFDIGMIGSSSSSSDSSDSIVSTAPDAAAMRSSYFLHISPAKIDTCSHPLLNLVQGAPLAAGVLLPPSSDTSALPSHYPFVQRCDNDNYHDHGTHRRSAPPR